jgi:ubiquinone/menaquinone biosynthesis C-methylase UbiE
MMTFDLIRRHLYGAWKAGGLGTRLKRRRFDRLCRHLNPLPPNPRVLEIGCSTGKDFLQFLPDGSEILGVDLIRYSELDPRINFVLADAEALPFPDKYFDLAVSIGLLEHVQPIEKLCNVIREIERVAKQYAVVVPCISTPFEPHVLRMGWQFRDHYSKTRFEALNYFSDDAWLQFGGFRNARTERLWYLPGLIHNLCIVGPQGAESLAKAKAAD